MLKDVTKLYQFAIFAAQPHEPHDVMYFLLDNNIEFQVILGCYRGLKETSYCIPAHSIDTVIQSGLLYDQESVLFLGYANDSSGIRRATMFDLSSEQFTELGDLVQASKINAESQDSWSYSLFARAYFVIQRDPVIEESPEYQIPEDGLPVIPDEAIGESLYAV